MIVVAVFHGPKTEGLLNERPEIAANPTMTIAGMNKIQDLVPTIEALGAYDAMYSSRMARALDTASVLSLALDLEFETLEDLGQCASGEKVAGQKELVVTHYPAYERGDMVSWQAAGLRALERIFDDCEGAEQDLIEDGEESEFSVLVVSHRPVIGGVLAHLKGVRDEAGIAAIVNDPTICAQGYVIFKIDEAGNISLAE